MKMFISNIVRKGGVILVLSVCLTFPSIAQESPKEEDFFKIAKVPAPEGILLEVGGLSMLPNGSLGVATRRGDVFVVENPTSSRPYFKRFASGLHEILGLHFENGSFYAVQRGELTRMQDTDSDGKADWYETVASWPLSAHYHEYSFGPKLAPDNTFIVTTNVAFGDQEWWRGESKVPYRGWTLKIHRNGKIEPFATGMRSPAGPGILNGEIFYTDNQGDYIASGGLWHLEKGDFSGHPAGLRWAQSEGSPIKMTSDQFNQVVDPMKIPNGNGGFAKPENVQDDNFITQYEAKELLPEIKLPAVWLPHGIHGISNSEPLVIPNDFWGPFGGQILIGDQGQSKIMRVMLEKVNGIYQGASIDFKSGFQSGVLRMVFSSDQSLFVGETNRGWGSAGDANEGLQRLVWNRAIPFEIRNVTAKPDGFEFEFTHPVDKKSAMDPSSYMISSFTYKYFPVYGSPPVRNQNHEIKGIEISDDGLRVRIALDKVNQFYVHRLALIGLRAADTYHELVHTDAYYTLNQIPSGQKMDRKVLVNQVTIINSDKAKSSEKPKNPTVKLPGTQNDQSIPTETEIKGLLAKNTCTACHATDKKQVGPSFKEIALRKYTPEKIVELIYNPKPENWPDYSTPMPPMPQVPKEEALKIAKWINSLK